MNETVNMILAFIAGLALGTLFFGGLWFTVKKAVTAKIPALWIFTSFFFGSALHWLDFILFHPATGKGCLFVRQVLLLPGSLLFILPKRQMQNKYN